VLPDRVQESLEAGLRRSQSPGWFTFADLFAGIGGTRLAFESVGGRCMFTAEWNKFAQRTYIENCGIDAYSVVK
jgi:DNA (cytosine-5)-methyltransferase 1